MLVKKAAAGSRQKNRGHFISCHFCGGYPTAPKDHVTAERGTRTICEMAVVLSHLSMGWSGDDDVDRYIQTSTGAADHDRLRHDVRHHVSGAGRRAVGRGAVAEDRGRQARGLGSHG